MKNLHWALSIATICFIFAFMVLIACLCRRRGPYVPHFYEPGTWWQSYWGPRPVKAAFTKYAVDGKGSDQIWEDFIGVLQPSSNSESCDDSQAENISEPLNSEKSAMRIEELPQTSRNLLGDLENSPRQLSEAVVVEQSPRNVEKQMMSLIQLNHRQYPQTLHSHRNDRGLIMPAHDTGVNLDSAEGSDNTVPQISLSRELEDLEE